MKRLILIALVILTAAVSFAQDSPGSGEDKRQYCAFVLEQAKADSLRLKTPSAVAGVTQPSSGTKPQAYGGVGGSLSDLRKSGQISAAARADCELYKATIDAQQKVQYAWAAFESEALQNRINAIDSAIRQIDILIAESKKAVDTQNATRMSLYTLEAARQRLVQDRGTAMSTLAASYVPEDLPQGPIMSLVNQKQAAEVSDKSAQTKVLKQDTWDVKWEAGYHRQVQAQAVNSGSPIAYPNGAYGDVQVNYNLARGRVNKHLNAAASHYAEWKAAQESDVVQSAVVIRQQMAKAIGVEDARLMSLRTQDGAIEAQKMVVKDGDTPNARAFYNQLASDELLLRVEIKDAEYRETRLKQLVDYDFVQRTNVPGMVSLTFDDGFESAYKIALPILDKAGLKASWYIVTKYLGHPSYMTADEVKALAADGQEVGSHTRNHKHLPTLTDAEQHDQIAESLPDFAALGIHPTTLAYPFGEFNEESVSEARAVGFKGARTVDVGRDNTDPFKLAGYPMHNTTLIGEVKAAIDAAQRNGTWLILVFHRVDEKDDNFINVQHELIQQIADYLVQQKVRVVTVDQGLTK